MSIEQLAIPLSVDEKASFDNFWSGKHQELIASFKAAVEHGQPSLVYCYGPEASGKSHLLYAAMRLASELKVNTSYLALTDPCINADMLSLVDLASVVCVDDISAWAGDNDKERALFSLFEQIKANDGCLLITASNAPLEQGFIIPDLASRLASGLIYPLHQLNEEQQGFVLKLRAKHKGLNIGDDVVKYLCQRTTRDTAKLILLLEELDHAALVAKRRITIPFVKQFLNSNKQSKT